LECWSFGMSTLALVVLLTCGGWLWVPVVLMIRPACEMHRARQVVRR
jgi:hypothetical protein